MHSLRRHLLAWLLPPLVIVVAVAAAGAYLLLRDRLTASYDQDLVDIASALVPHVTRRDGELILAVSPQTDKVLRSDTRDRVFYAARGVKGELIGGDRDLVVPPELAFPGLHFWNTSLHGERCAWPRARKAWTERS
jgi:two-component system sensor histidine kinase TctE